MINLIKSLLSKPMRNAYYQGRESLLGDHKRDIVVVQVDQACESLKESRDQFVDALEKFKTIVRLDDTPLEQRYQHLKKRYDHCRYKAEQVSQRIKAIEDVSEALFAEWEAELELYSNRALKARSQQQLKKSRQQYGRLLKALQIAETRMHPVLAAFQDQVLFLKHNLNAHAIAALRHEFVEIGVDISKLIDVMEKTIAEASQFVSILVDQKQLPAPARPKRLT
jgi:tetratricopeptide (TPR) repeat protein